MVKPIGAAMNSMKFVFLGMKRTVNLFLLLHDKERIVVQIAKECDIRPGTHNESKTHARYNMLRTHSTRQ